MIATIIIGVIFAVVFAWWLYEAVRLLTGWRS